MEGLRKRSSKLESFLRKNLSHAESDSIRYYESCVGESKGALALRHLVLTDESLYVTQNPPKSLTHSISLSQIQEVNLVPDRRLVSGGPPNNAYVSQHVQILYKPLKPDGEGEGNDLDLEGGHGQPLTRGSNLMIPHGVQTAYTSHVHLPLSPQRSERDKVLSSDTELESNSSGSHSEESRSDSSLSVRASSVLEQKLSSWRSNGEPVEEDRQRPSSVDISQLPSFRKRILGRVFRRKAKANGVDSQNVKPLKTEPEAEGLEAVDLYVYEPESAFIHELFLYWGRCRLKSTLEMGKGLETKGRPAYGLRVTEEERLLDDLERLEALVRVDSTSSSKLKFFLLFPFLCNFHDRLSRYPHLKRLSIKSPSLVSCLVQAIKLCIQPERPERSGAEDELLDGLIYPRFQEQLSTCIMLLDIFRLLLESTSSGTIFLEPSVDALNNNGSLRKNNNGSRLNWNSVIEVLLQGIFSYPCFTSEVSAKERTLLQATTSHPQKLVKLEPDAPNTDIIQLVTMGHNTGAALLYEILSVIHYSRGEPGRASFLSFLKSFQMESYLRQSVTQVIHLLWSTHPQLTPPQCVLFHRHVSVLKTLVSNLVFPKAFIRHYYTEEFQYFTHETSADIKVPDRYPIKPKLLTTFNELREVILKPAK